MYFGATSTIYKHYFFFRVIDYCISHRLNFFQTNYVSRMFYLKVCCIILVPFLPFYVLFVLVVYIIVKGSTHSFKRFAIYKIIFLCIYAPITSDKWHA